jgi:hypothetical protein
MFVTCTIAWRTAIFPRPLTLAGFLLALVMLLSLSYLQWIVLLFPVWVCVASGYILVAELRAARLRASRRRRTRPWARAKALAAEGARVDIARTALSPTLLSQASVAPAPTPLTTGGRGVPSGIEAMSCGARTTVSPWHFFTLRPEPHGHGSLRPASVIASAISVSKRASKGMTSRTSRFVLSSWTMTFAGRSIWRKNVM